MYSINTLGIPCGSAGKESTCNAGDLGSILGLGRSPEEGKGNTLQYSGLDMLLFPPLFPFCYYGHKFYFYVINSTIHR